MPKKKAYRKRVFAKDGTESDLERAFLSHWLTLFPNHPPVTQHQFHPVRQWQFDFAWPNQRIAVEVQGFGPGHFSLAGATNDYDKNLAAHKLQWRIVYLTSIHLSPQKIGKVCLDIAELLRIPLRAPATRFPSTGYVPINRRNK